MMKYIIIFIGMFLMCFAGPALAYLGMEKPSHFVMFGTIMGMSYMVILYCMDLSEQINKGKG